MSFRKSLWACGAALVVGSALLAAEPSDSGNGSTRQTPSHSHVRLTKPWNELKDLTDDEKAKLLEIHQKAADEIKEINSKEREDMLAVLTDDQKKELNKVEAKDREMQRANRSKRATTQPADSTSNEK